MKIIDCFMYFDEDMVLDIRLNTLIDEVDKFIIVEATKNHAGIDKKLNFKFENFLKSQEFVNKVGEISEAEGHHPDLWFGWGYARIKIFTHAIKGLAESDFILAAKIDRIC